MTCECRPTQISGWATLAKIWLSVTGEGKREHKGPELILSPWSWREKTVCWIKQWQEGKGKAGGITERPLRQIPTVVTRWRVETSDSHCYKPLRLVHRPKWEGKLLGDYKQWKLQITFEQEWKWTEEGQVSTLINSGNCWSQVMRCMELICACIWCKFLQFEKLSKYTGQLRNSYRLLRYRSWPKKFMFSN